MYLHCRSSGFTICIYTRGACALMRREKTLFKNILALENSPTKVKFIANKGVDKGCILCQRIIYNILFPESTSVGGGQR